LGMGDGKWLMGEWAMRGRAGVGKGILGRHGFPADGKAATSLRCDEAATAAQACRRSPKLWRQHVLPRGGFAEEEEEEEGADGDEAEGGGFG
jgi:hypothetical protein